MCALSHSLATRRCTTRRRAGGSGGPACDAGARVHTPGTRWCLRGAAAPRLLVSWRRTTGAFTLPHFLLLSPFSPSLPLYFPRCLPCHPLTPVVRGPLAPVRLLLVTPLTQLATNQHPYHLSYDYRQLSASYFLPARSDAPPARAFLHSQQPPPPLCQTHRECQHPQTWCRLSPPA
jgi:hypothetical protein